MKCPNWCSNGSRKACANISSLKSAKLSKWRRANWVPMRWPGEAPALLSSDWTRTRRSTSRRRTEIMPPKALATDYDGTLAWHSMVEYSTCTALQKLKDSGRKLILVTGRELHELFSVFSSARIFDRIVAE